MSRKSAALAAGTIIIAAAAAAATVSRIPRNVGRSIDGETSTAVATAAAAGTSRVLEARLGHPQADRYRPYLDAGPTRSTATRGHPLPLAAMAALEERGDHHGIATIYLLEGGALRQAEAHLARAPASPGVANDRAVIALQRNDPEQALAILEPIVRAHPRHGLALWNRALALRALGLDLGAAASFEAAAALSKEPGQDGWAAEAADHAKSLREAVQRRQGGWRTAEERRRRLIADGVVLPRSLVASHPDLAREALYDALRAAGTARAAAKLHDLAAALDERAGRDSVLRGVVTRTAGGAHSARRKRLAAQYRDLVLADRPPPPAETDAFLEEAGRDPDAADIFFGALIRTKRAYRRSADLAQAAARVGDPYLALQAEDYCAIAETQIEHQPLRAERRLGEALRRCDEHAFGRLCLRLRLTLSWLLSHQHRMSEARKLASFVQQQARATGDAEHELLALERLGLSAFAGSATGALVRAYTEERPLREPGACAVRVAAAESLASMALRALDVDEARRRIKEATGCPSRGLSRVAVLATLARFHGTAEEAARFDQALAELRSDPRGLPAASAAVVTAYEGRAFLLRDRAAGRRLLAQAAEAARALSEDDESTLTARWLSQIALAFDAARDGAYADALSFILAEERVTTSLQPRECLLAVAADLERTVAVMKDVRGTLDGELQTHAALPYDLAAVVPPRMRAALGACPAVTVVAPPPLYGMARLLPSGAAWSYRLGGPTRGMSAAAASAAAADHRRLVISDVVPAPHLQLPPVGRWRPRARADDTLISVSGAAATPARTLAEMAGADEIDLHVHGIVDPAVTDASFLVLAPDAGGAFTLSVDDVRRAKLARRPVVLLAACHGADRSRAHYNTWGLPRAFLEAGARVVIAASAAVPDDEAGVFFDAVSDDIAAGVSPRVALRDQRNRWHSAHPEGAQGWVDDVLVFE